MLNSSMSTDGRVATRQQRMTFCFSHDDDYRTQPVYWIILYSTPSFNMVFSTHGLKPLNAGGKGKKLPNDAIFKYMWINIGELQ
jgi:hypothetical protein